MIPNFYKGWTLEDYRAATGNKFSAPVLVERWNDACDRESASRVANTAQETDAAMQDKLQIASDALDALLRTYACSATSSSRSLKAVNVFTGKVLNVDALEYAYGTIVAKPGELKALRGPSFRIGDLKDTEPASVVQIWHAMTLRAGRTVAPEEVYRPDMSIPLCQPEGSDMLVLNTYVPPAWMFLTEEEKATGDAEFFVKYLEALIPEKVARDWFIAMLGFNMLHPMYVTPMAILFAPDEGYGRDTMFDFLKVMYGKQNTRSLETQIFDPTTSKGMFQPWRGDTVLGLVSEATDGTRAMGRDKVDLVTAHTRQLANPGLHEGEVVGKHKDGKKSPLICSLICATNAPDAFSLSDSDRRFLVTRNGRVPKTIADTFLEAMERPEHVAAAAQYCMERAFASTAEAMAAPPETASKNAMRMETRDKVAHYLQLALDDKAYLPGEVLALTQIKAAVVMLWEESETAGMSDKDMGRIARQVKRYCIGEPARVKYGKTPQRLREIGKSYPAQQMVYIAPRVSEKTRARWQTVLDLGLERTDLQQRQLIRELDLNDAALFNVGGDVTKPVPRSKPALELVASDKRTSPSQKPDTSDEDYILS